MNMGSIWPDRLESARIDDNRFAEAYEQTPARLRSLLKAGIALAHFHYGSTAALQVSELENRHAGYWQKVIKKPADWACLFFEGSESAAALVCATAILPVLANVPQILAICCGRPEARLLVGLELCGIEDVFSLEQEQCAGLIAELCAKAGGQGRICALNCDVLRHCLDELQNPAVRVARLANPQRLLLKSPAAFSREELEFCLGRVPTTEMTGPAQCIYVEDPADDRQEGELKIGPGCEGFWLFPSHGPAFYQQGSFYFAETRIEPEWA